MGPWRTVRSAAHYLDIAPSGAQRETLGRFTLVLSCGHDTERRARRYRGSSPSVEQGHQNTPGGWILPPPTVVRCEDCPLPSDGEDARPAAAAGAAATGA